MWHRRINAAVVVLTIVLFLSLLFPWIQRQREAARRAQSANNLKQIGLALLNYADTFRSLPPGGVFNVERHGFHGWMTSILPFMDDNPFYSFVDFNEPWDSTRNAGLFLNAMPCYENPSEPKVHRHWEFPVAHYSGNAHLMAINSFVALHSIPDKSQTFFVGELDGGFFPWGCPYNWRKLDKLNAIPPTFGRSTHDGCQFVFADGSVKFVSNEQSKGNVTRILGTDLAQGESAMLNVQIPSEFPCPGDTLWLSWTYENGARVEVKRDIRGNVVSQRRVGGK